MKKYLALVLMVTALLAMTACGNKNSETDDSQTAEAVTASEETAGAQEEASEEAKEEDKSAETSEKAAETKAAEKTETSGDASGSESDAEAAASEGTSDAVSGTEDVKEFEKSADPIATPKWDVWVPDSFEGNVISEVTCEDPYTLVFKAAADGTELFTLTFGGTGDVLMGTLEGENGSTVVYMSFADLDMTNANYADYVGYQQAVNTIMNGWKLHYTFHQNEIVESGDDDTFIIETPLVNLQYPSKYKDRVQVQVLGNGVDFSADGVTLFDLIFEDCDGFLLGTYNGTPIYIVDYILEDQEYIAMQAAVNVIIDHLREDPAFVINS